MRDSYFDGGLFQLIGYSIIGALITLVTLGICYPWAIVMIINWKTKHTVIDGQRLRFEGTAMGLFGSWIKWLFLIIITIGSYAFWVNIAMKKCVTKHTHFAY